MKPWAVRIDSDLFGIADRLKSIDDGYFIVYDRRKGAYEVHHARQRGDTFALTVPYPCLDERTVKLVRRTRCERAESLMREIEKENERRARLQAKGQIEQAAANIDAALSKA